MCACEYLIRVCVLSIVYICLPYHNCHHHYFSTPELDELNVLIVEDVGRFVFKVENLTDNMTIENNKQTINSKQ